MTIAPLAPCRPSDGVEEKHLRGFLSQQEDRKLLNMSYISIILINRYD
jgi:hypothetical protein